MVARLKRLGYFSRKFTLTAGSLLAVFVLAALGKDVKALEIIVPAILLFYGGSNVLQKHVVKQEDLNSGNQN